MVDNWNWEDELAFHNDPCRFDLRNDNGGRGWCDSSAHGGRGWYDSNASDDKCILDEAIATLLVSMGYDVPTT